LAPAQSRAQWAPACRNKTGTAMRRQGRTRRSASTTRPPHCSPSSWRARHVVVIQDRNAAVVQTDHRQFHAGRDLLHLTDGPDPDGTAQRDRRRTPRELDRMPARSPGGGPSQVSGRNPRQRRVGPHHQRSAGLNLNPIPAPGIEAKASTIEDNPAVVIALLGLLRREFAARYPSSAVPLACHIRRTSSVTGGQPRSLSRRSRLGLLTLLLHERIPWICLIRMRSQVQGRAAAAVRGHEHQ
jgi:hypothetical protein